MTIHHILVSFMQESKPSWSEYYWTTLVLVTDIKSIFMYLYITVNILAYRYTIITKKQRQLLKNVCRCLSWINNTYTFIITLEPHGSFFFSFVISYHSYIFINFSAWKISPDVFVNAKIRSKHDDKESGLTHITTAQRDLTTCRHIWKQHTWL